MSAHSYILNGLGIHTNVSLFKGKKETKAYNSLLEWPNEASFFY